MLSWPSPDPALDARPWSAVVYFVSFLFVILWLVVPLILAIVYDFYKVGASGGRGWHAGAWLWPELTPLCGGGRKYTRSAS